MITTYEAWDTLFFRDGKPFSMGEDTWATSIFPPLPSTIYGALRTGYLAKNPTRADTIEQDTKKFAIKGIFLKQGDHFLFPAPADTHTVKGEPGAVHLEYDFGAPSAGVALSAGHLEVFKMRDKDKKPPEGIFLKKEHFQDYLNDVESDTDALSFLDAVEIESLVAYENKIGIGRDNATRSIQESMLYRVQMQRWGSLKFSSTAALRHTGGVQRQCWDSLKLVIDSNFEILDKKAPSQLRLGGEGKAIRLSAEASLPNIPDPDPEQLLPCFKLYFATPALFRNGWLPEGLKQKKGGQVQGTWHGVELELLAAFVGKPLRIGGFDIKKRTPKPMRQAIPAGSVFYFRANDANVGDIIENFHGQAISDILSEQGYGISYVGLLNHSKFKND